MSECKLWSQNVSLVPWSAVRYVLLLSCIYLATIYQCTLIFHCFIVTDVYCCIREEYSSIQNLYMLMTINGCSLRLCLRSHCRWYWDDIHCAILFVAWQMGSEVSR